MIDYERIEVRTGGVINIINSSQEELSARMIVRVAYNNMLLPIYIIRMRVHIKCTKVRLFVESCK